MRAKQHSSFEGNGNVSSEKNTLLFKTERFINILKHILGAGFNKQK